MNIVKELRKKAGIQQKALAIGIGVSRPTVSEWESGKKDPSGERLKKLAKFFEVDELVILGKGVIDLSDDLPDVPKTPEARTVSAGMDELPPEQRQLIVNMVTAMYPDVFKKSKGTDKNDTEL